MKDKAAGEGREHVLWAEGRHDMLGCQTVTLSPWPPCVLLNCRIVSCPEKHCRIVSSPEKGGVREGCEESSVMGIFLGEVLGVGI